MEKQSCQAGNDPCKAWRKHYFKGPKIIVNIKGSNAVLILIHWENDQISLGKKYLMIQEVTL